MSQDDQDAVEGRLRREYREATKVYDVLVERARARQHGDQMVKLGDALRRNPGDMLIGTEDRTLTRAHQIRSSADVVAQYKERLKPYGN